MPRKNVKAAQVMDLLNRSVFGNTKIAEMVGCSPSYVHALRKKMVHVDEPEAQPVQHDFSIFWGQPEPDNVLTLLNERHNTYGTFTECARIAQGFKDYMRRNADWDALAPDQRESLELIATKLARVLNGDCNYADSWKDVAGYAQLVADRLEGRVR